MRSAEDDRRAWLPGNLFLRRETELGMTQEELARRLDVSVETIDQWEQGKVLIPKGYIPRLAKALGTTSGYLLRTDQDSVASELPKAGSVGEAIRRAREAKGWRRTDLAVALNCTYYSVYQWETDRTHVPERRIEEIAALLDVDPESISGIS